MLGSTSNKNNLDMIQTSSRSRIACDEHPNEEITNYCCNLHCLKPLCPECVEVHTKSHSKQEIQSWKNCINNTLKQLKNTHFCLKQIQGKLNNNRAGRSVEAIQEEAIRKLGDVRREIYKMVDDIFNHHERELRNIIRNELRSTPIDLSKLKVAIDQVQKLTMKVASTNTVIPALKKSILLDHSALIAHFEQQYRNTPPQTMKDQFFLNIDQEDLSKLRRNLQRLINYDSTEVAPMPKIVHQDLFSLPKDNMYERGLTINRQDYFRETTSKYLHFFVSFSNQLKLLHISQLNTNPLNWKTIKLAMTGTIPSFYKSIITPAGEIYLTGGMGNQKLNSIYRFNHEKGSLDYITDMITARSSHALCYANGSIYIVGGFKVNNETAKECEVLNIQSRKCKSVGPLGHPSANCCVSAFNNEHLFKFGGILQADQPSHFIQMFTIRDNTWVTVDPDLQRYTERIWITSFSAAVQINSNEIFIFGGYNDLDNQTSSTMSYTLCVQRRGSETVYNLRNIGAYPLPEAQGFWDNSPIVMGNQVIALQNVSDTDQISAVTDERRVLVFNGKRWSSL